jgi:hypothetical protein
MAPACWHGAPSAAALQIRRAATPFWTKTQPPAASEHAGLPHAMSASSSLAADPGSASTATSFASRDSAALGLASSSDADEGLSTAAASLASGSSSMRQMDGSSSSSSTHSSSRLSGRPGSIRNVSTVSALLEELLAAHEPGKRRRGPQRVATFCGSSLSASSRSSQAPGGASCPLLLHSLNPLPPPWLCATPSCYPCMLAKLLSMAGPVPRIGAHSGHLLLGGHGG